MDPQVDMNKFFKTHEKDFTSYGGDTNRLLFYCKLSYASKKFIELIEKNKRGDTSQPEMLVSKVIEFDVLSDGLSQLQNNNAKKKDEIDRDILFSMYT